MSTFTDSDVLDAADAALSVIFEDAHEPVERSVDEAPAEQPRDELGRFASVSEDPEEGTPEEPEGAETPEATPELDGQAEETDEPQVEEDVIELEVDDPEVLSFLEKYDGDVIAALKAATEAQSLLGRQGQELGSLRNETKELEALRQEFAALQQQIQLQSMASTVDWDEAIENDPAQAAQMAVGLRNPHLLERVMDSWKEDDPFAAMMFLNQLSQAAAQEAAQYDDQEPEDLSGEMDSLKQRYPDITENLPAIQKLAEERPVLRQALYDGDARSRAQALEDLYLLSRSQTQASDTSTAARKIYLRAKAEADAAKADAAVVSASNTSAASANPAPSGNEFLRDVLAESLGDDFVIE